MKWVLRKESVGKTLQGPLQNQRSQDNHGLYDVTISTNQTNDKSVPETDLVIGKRSMAKKSLVNT